MNRKLFSALLVVTVLCAFSGCLAYRSLMKGFSLAQFKETHGPVLQKIESAAVLFRKNKRRWAGVAISPDGKVLTALHCLAGSTNHSFNTKNGRLIENLEVSHWGSYGANEFEDATVIAAFPKLDVAIMDIGLPTPSYLSASRAGPKQEDIVFLVGASTGIVQMAAGHYFGCSESIPPDRASLWVDGPAFGGDSGGALVNERGELLGVMTSVFDRKNVSSLKAANPTVLSGRSHITIATALPPQLITAMINSRVRLNYSSSKGSVEKSWGSISLTQPSAGENMLPFFKNKKRMQHNLALYKELCSALLHTIL